MREENEELYRQNSELVGQLRAAEVKNDELSQEVAVEKERKEALDANMKKMDEEYKATINRIAVEHKVAMARSEQKQTKALEERKNLENLSNIAQELKSNILLYAQVMGGPFDARRVDLDALYDVDMNQLGFDIHFPSRAVWDKFGSKWRKSKDFFLNEDPNETNVAHTNNNEADGDPAKVNFAPANGNGNFEVVGKEREDVIPSDHRGLMIFLK
ncbi:hypothetical protein PVK06_029820 [Gossypium arboreum]|uniref:Uncharacterized protein n=1 Tax=Gossypium arboreum TaxID=29729 RepID=A0ABR0NLL8_GOSAR|nr:hypothetical protein PVK06_029820 [Gossypium arboreum]